VPGFERRAAIRRMVGIDRVHAVKLGRGEAGVRPDVLDVLVDIIEPPSRDPLLPATPASVVTTPPGVILRTVKLRVSAT
jgi:hypothetical protein